MRRNASSPAQPSPWAQTSPELFAPSDDLPGQSRYGTSSSHSARSSPLSTSGLAPLSAVSGRHRRASITSAPVIPSPAASPRPATTDESWVDAKAEFKRSSQARDWQPSTPDAKFSATTDAWAMGKAGTKAEAKAEAKVEAKAGAKSEAKAQAKADAKAQADAKAESKTWAVSVPKRPTRRPSMKVRNASMRSSSRRRNSLTAPDDTLEAQQNLQVLDMLQQAAKSLQRTQPSASPTPPPPRSERRGDEVPPEQPQPERPGARMSAAVRRASLRSNASRVRRLSLSTPVEGALTSLVKSASNDSQASSVSTGAGPGVLHRRAGSGPASSTGADQSALTFLAGQHIDHLQLGPDQHIM